MIKNETVLEVNIGDRIYKFSCSPQSPLGELHDALFQMKNFVIEKIIESNKATETNRSDSIEVVKD